MPKKKEQIDALVKAERDLFSYKDRASTAESKYRTLMREHLSLKRELDAVHELQTAKRKVHKIDMHTSSESEAIPIIVLSDWHVEEEVRPSSVNGLNKFNLDIAEKRAKKCFQSTLHLIRKEQREVKMDTAVIVLNGDFISGNIHEELLASCLLRPIHAISFAEDLLVSGIDFLLEHTELRFVIPCKVGNHTRITRKVHIAGESGNSLETTMYYSMSRRYKDEPRVTFIIEDSYLTHLPIYGKIVRIHHGHAIKFHGGIGGLHIPLRRAIGEWNRTEPAFFDVLGHFHQYSNTTPKYSCNGSLMGYNPFAMFIKGVYEPPYQAFTLFDKRHGITGQFPIFTE